MASVKVTMNAAGEVRVVKTEHLASRLRVAAQRELTTLSSAGTVGGAGSLGCSEKLARNISRDKSVQAGHGKLGIRHKFTSQARRLVRSCVEICEATYGKSNAVFLTSTLPGSTRACYEVLARYSARVAKHCLRFLRDAVPRCEVVFIYEHQKRGALHAHILVCSHDAEALVRVMRDWRMFWIAELEYLCDVSGVDMFGDGHGKTWKGCVPSCITKVERIKKSLSRYLSKYISKRSDSATGRAALCPTRWYAISQSLRDVELRMRRCAVVSQLSTSAATELYNELVALANPKQAPEFSYRSKYDGWTSGTIICGSYSPVLFDALAGIARLFGAVHSADAGIAAAHVGECIKRVPVGSCERSHVAGKNRERIETAWNQLVTEHWSHLESFRDPEIKEAPPFPEAPLDICEQLTLRELISRPY